MGTNAMVSRRPPPEIRHQDLTTEVYLRLVEDDPAARTAAAPLERWPELLTKSRGRRRVRHRGPQAEDQLSRNYLRHLVGWCPENVHVGSRPLCRIAHDENDDTTGYFDAFLRQ